MNNQTLTHDDVCKIVNQIPAGLNDDHLIALVLTVVSMQREDGGPGRVVAALCGVLMTYCRSIGMPGDTFQLIAAQLDRTYSHQGTVRH